MAGGEIQNLSKNLSSESQVNSDLELEANLNLFLSPAQQSPIVHQSLKKYVSTCHIVMITNSL